MKKKLSSTIKKIFFSEKKIDTTPEDREKKIREASRKVGKQFERALIRLSER